METLCSNYDEIAMQQSLLFSDSLKDLRNLRKQLYAAAEYFELSYTNDEQKQTVVDTLKDYAIKALVNTVDHLGAVSSKVDDLLAEKGNEVSATELRLSCIQQRLRVCQGCFDHEGLAEQSSFINVPKYHKKYILPVEETMKGGIRTKSKYRGCSLDDEDDSHEFKNVPQVQTIQPPGSFVFVGAMTGKDIEKRTVSPCRISLLQTGSLSFRSNTTNSRPNSRSTTPNRSRSTTPTSVGRQRLSEPRKSASMRIHANRETYKTTDQIPSKSKRLLEALLSRRKSKKDDTLCTYLDEYY